MPEVTSRIGPVAGGVALLVALTVAGCGSPTPPPAPPASPTTVSPAALPPAASPTTTPAPTTTRAALPVVTARDGTNVKACADGACEVAIDGPSTFRVGDFRTTVTPGADGVAVRVVFPSGTVGTTTLSGVGPGGSFSTSSGLRVQAGLAGRDDRGRPVVTFSRG
ncbi:hypothetical protein [Actinomycetospora termitidis]|uniref:Uncharacterized protein n=1 Tax=Actinomycetospora termitidis TaxID=3053470 RepID=A0ABT7MCR9_9PSEU|nr:hypothetical protein [Actinomycetospora sp. Odt1-22]MDL5158261.1 hypothetical protein [Actinomycetospora sp. Odt1-22]